MVIIQYMTNTTEQTTTRKCQYCRLTFTTLADWDSQYNWELNGFCSYTCEADYTDSCNRYDRRYKP